MKIKGNVRGSSLLSSVCPEEQWHVCDFRSADAILKDYGKNWSSVWVKMASSWVCIFVYIFTLFVPQCLPGRDFAYIEGADELTPRRGRHGGTLV